MSKRPALKQFGDLTLQDFHQHPVWINVHVVDYDEPWYDDTDEETFRPWLGSLPVSPEEGMLLAKARFTLADRRVIPGFATPQHEDEEPDLGMIQPHLFLPSGQTISFWHGMSKPASDDLKHFYEELAAAADRVFPIQFSAESGLAQGIIAGTIEGFYYQDAGDNILMIQ